MYSLVYGSAATVRFTEADLERLLVGARAWNESVGVTGMLLYKEGWFMQVLEGDEKMVKKTFKMIKKDRRHREVSILAEATTDARQFPEWTMGFRAMTAENLPRVPGYSSFLDNDEQGPSFDSPTRARVLLDWFRLRPA